LTPSSLAILQQQQAFFNSRTTYPYAFRVKQLEALKQALYTHENQIYEALYEDLKKNKEECWVTEIGFTIAEINNAIKNLKKWMKPSRVKTNLLNFPSKSYILAEPLGVVLIIGPWNYPLQLLLAPLVGAIAAGNCAVLKPSEMAPATAAILEKIIKSAFEPQYITLIQGEGSVIIPAMMDHFRFDHVFYTGSTQVGRIIYQMAASKLVPVTLELGGKSPCIIEKDADTKVAAKRIALTKFSNAGQMCVAPDYLLVHEDVKEQLISDLKKQIDAFYNAENVRDYHFGKIINERSFLRLQDYLRAGKVIYGGGSNATTQFIEPTLLEHVSPEDPVMQEEIFGPLLPIISWKEDPEVYQHISFNNNPLALYVFTSDKRKADKWMTTIPFGGGCINNASWHLTNHHLPFGGRGNSGIGAYHGQFSFEAFSHKKAIMHTPTWLDPSIKYPPFRGKLNLFKKVIR
jgi:aldehyde dehydrogenase (NAD+)